MLASAVGSLVGADCSNFNGEMGCVGQQVYYPDDWAHRSFQTWLPGDEHYKDSYEYLGKFACYPSVTYSSNRESATVEVRCRTMQNFSGQLAYQADGGDWQTSNVFTVNATSSKTPMKIVVADSKTQYKEANHLEDVDFAWNAPSVNQPSNYKNGQKGAIVEMFGWPYADIEAECEQLGKSGYLGIKVFPPQESVITDEWPQNGELNPWWFLYQPVSYRLSGRHGSRDELRKMINTCRSQGVRVYADAVVNHMAGGGNDVWPGHRNGGGGGYCATWSAKSSTGPSPYFTHSFDYENSTRTGLRPGDEFPGVPYNPTDFHCERPLNSWTSPFDLNYGWLTGLADLNTESEYVQERIASYFTDLLGIGFSGFRIDAAKHIKPDDLTQILKRFKDHMGGGDLPDDFISYLEVLVGGEKDLLMCNDGDYNFAASFAKKMKAGGLSDSDINKIKIWQSAYPKEFPICGYWEIPSERFAAQLDCHDDQNPGSSSRDMGDKGTVLIKQKNVQLHRQFEEQLFSRTDGDWQIKLVLSSYSFMSNGAQGIPDGKSDCSKCEGDQCKSCSKSMPFSKAHDPNVCGYTCEVDGQWKEGVYTRVHRDYDVIQSMRDWMGLPKVSDPTALGLPSHCESAYETERVFE